ncbi:MAG: 4-hydroxy-3-methylbut-2-enyl diphosphate reductase [Verrucomicrobiales bacterium]|nr:4-hydroxy-3-methylbut-2-enyl diphosphate reductase [Verrucomicrobiales bacterium]
MKIIRAQYLGMCFGVRDAITMAKERGATEPLTILGELVHNEMVLNDLRNAGIQTAQHLDNVLTKSVMITAHGASERKMQEVRDRGFDVVEATCPLVHFAHNSLKKLVGQGCHPIIIGKRDHVEVRGMTEDLAHFDVVLSVEDIQQLEPHPKFGVVSQTTQPIDKVRELVALIRKRFVNSEVCFLDTVCQPTKQRQRAAIELAKNVDVVVVIGGAHSNNTRELVTTCASYCSRVHHVQNAGDLKPEWFLDNDLIGITAGTSTSDVVINEIEHSISVLRFERNCSVHA